MAEIDYHLVASKITSTIKLTGILHSAVHEHFWALDETDARPSSLPILLTTLQTVRKSLSALLKFATDDTDLVASVLHRLTGPVYDCAAEMDRLRVRIVDGGLEDMLDRGLVFEYIAQLEKQQGVFALSLKVMQDHWYVGASWVHGVLFADEEVRKLSKTLGGYIQDSDNGGFELDDPVLPSGEVCTFPSDSSSCTILRGRAADLI